MICSRHIHPLSTSFDNLVVKGNLCNEHIIFTIIIGSGVNYFLRCCNIFICDFITFRWKSA